jgi:ABC-type sulfate transport system permease subunit
MALEVMEAVAAVAVPVAMVVAVTVSTAIPNESFCGRSKKAREYPAQENPLEAMF